MLWALGWEEGVSRQCEARGRVPTGSYYSAREEGTGGAGVLGEESLRSPCVPLSGDWYVPH